MRKPNLEIRKTYGENRMFEIVKLYDNPYFGKENDYPFVENGMRRKTEISKSRVSESLFKSKELCYVIAFIENGIVDFVGDRFSELDKEKEIFDFVWLLRKAISKSIRYKSNVDIS